MPRAFVRLALTGRALLLLVATAVGDRAEAVPPGRSWATAGTVALPGRGFASPLGLFSAAGGLTIVAGSRGVGAEDSSLVWATLSWRDTAWAEPRPSSWTAGFSPELATSADSRTHLAWLTIPPGQPGFAHLLLAAIEDGRVLPPDTALVTTTQASEYAAAVSRTGRRWVARTDQLASDSGFTVRVAWSDERGSWHELPRLGIDEMMCAVAPLNDRDAIVAHAGRSGLNWATTDGTRWIRRGTLDPRPNVPLHPRLRIGAGGTLWLYWTDKERAHVALWKGRRWFHEDSMTCPHPRGQQFWSTWCDMSDEAGDSPILAWGDRGYGHTHRDILCASFRSDTGWSIGEEVKGSDGGFVPSVAIDRLGDAWIAWWRPRDPAFHFTHTYVKAEARETRAVIHGARAELSWILSEAAPGSWWTVLRSSGDHGFEEAARLRAGKEARMRWTDPSAARDAPIRYRIRRESLDARYVWISDIVGP